MGSYPQMFKRLSPRLFKMHSFQQVFCSRISRFQPLPRLHLCWSQQAPPGAGGWAQSPKSVAGTASAFVLVLQGQAFQVSCLNRSSNGEANNAVLGCEPGQKIVCQVQLDR